MIKRISRADIIRMRADLTRQGLKPAFTNSFQVGEKVRINIPQRSASTTFRSPLTSQVYFSVFCEGEKKQLTV